MAIDLICDGQFGSTGKGLLAGYLATCPKAPSAIITAWGPNAGHTFTDDDGREYIHQMVGNGIVSPNFKTLFLGPGSVISAKQLAEEISMNMDHFTKNNANIYIHENTILVKPEYKTAEENDSAKLGIGSTQKGVGHAVAMKILRDPSMNVVIRDLRKEFIQDLVEVFTKNACDFDLDNIKIISAMRWPRMVFNHSDILIEGAQGFSLGINSGFYPYVTSRECTPTQILSDCALPLLRKGQMTIYGTLRTYPIRVGNRYDAEGNMVGFSGPGYPGQREIEWEKIGIKPELTTVTHRPRRIFEFNNHQLEHFIATVDPDNLFLNFCNYCSSDELDELDDMILDAHGRVPMMYGYGPKRGDVKTYRDPSRERPNGKA